MERRQMISPAELPDVPSIDERQRMAAAFDRAIVNDQDETNEALRYGIMQGYVIFQEPDRLILTKLGYLTCPSVAVGNA
jgi:hypothetical protein